jgi:hypothetical protein
MFRFNFATEAWASTVELKSWKLMPYPKPSKETTTETALASSGIGSDGEGSMAYFHVDIGYPIAARNVPMVRMCLDQGVDVNKTLHWYSHGVMTPLTKAVTTAYEYGLYGPCDIKALLLMRRDSRKIIRLLLEYGADPSQRDEKGVNAQQMADQLCLNDRHEPDWLIRELLSPAPHAKLPDLLSMTDAVWAGESGKLEAILAEDPELYHLAEHHRVSPLGVAVYRGDEHMVNILLNYGASLDALDSIGSSPLAIAVASNLDDMARLLRQRGASLDSRDRNLQNSTPLEYAAANGTPTMCKALIGHWTAQNPVDRKHQLSQSLASAVRHFRAETVVLLLYNGADIFVDMRPFLKGEELNGSLGDNLTPREFVVDCIKVSPFLPGYGQSRSDILKILESYEQQANRKTCEETAIGVLNNGIREVSLTKPETSIETEYQRKKEQILALQTQSSSLNSDSTS